MNVHRSVNRSVRNMSMPTVMVPNMIAVMAAALLLLPSGQAQEAAAQTSTNIQDQVQLALDNSRRMYRDDFDVTVFSTQINGIIKQKVTASSPLPLSIDQITLRQRGGKSTLKATIKGIPPQFRPPIEQKLNAQLNKSHLGALWSKTTTSFLTYTEDAITDGGQLKLINETDTTQIVAIEALDLIFHGGIRLNAIRLIIDKKTERVTGARLYLTEAKDLTVMIDYDDIELEGNTSPLPVWSRVSVTQNSWMGSMFGFPGWPNKIVVDYLDYRTTGTF